MTALPAIQSEFELSYSDFSRVRAALQQAVGIVLQDKQKDLVVTRLSRRVRKLGLSGLRAYLDMALSYGSDEFQQFVHLLTTHETFFFRESDHFDLLKAGPLREWRRGKEFSAWCAACSTGEEVYSLAMTLGETLGRSPWRILGSDISESVVKQARRGHFPLRRLDALPKPYLSKYFLRGTGKQSGSILVDRDLRQRTRFEVVNLMIALPGLGTFDVIFLRNVLIYFPPALQQAVLTRVVSALRPGGYLFVGGSESLQGMQHNLESVGRAAFRMKTK